MTRTPLHWSRLVRGTCKSCGAVVDGRGHPLWWQVGLGGSLPSDPVRKEAARKARDAAVEAGTVPYRYWTLKHKCKYKTGDGKGCEMTDVQVRTPREKPKRGLARLSLKELKSLLAKVQAEIASRPTRQGTSAPRPRSGSR